MTISDKYVLSGNGNLVEKTKRETELHAELPFGTHRDSPYDDMEKFRYLPTVMLTSGQGSRPFGQIRSRNV
jgi:hypothetical protein